MEIKEFPLSQLPVLLINTSYQARESRHVRSDWRILNLQLITMHCLER